MFVPRPGSDAAATGPRLREITIQYTLKRGVDGRPIRLGAPVTHSWAAAQVLAQILAHEPVEVFGVLCVTLKGRVLGWHEISRGAIDGVWIHARDVLRAALSSNAASIILAHNHPSGEADPSQDDLQMTKYLFEAARHVGVASSITSSWAIANSPAYESPQRHLLRKHTTSSLARPSISRWVAGSSARKGGCRRTKSVFVNRDDGSGVSWSRIRGGPE